MKFNILKGGEEVVLMNNKVHNLRTGDRPVPSGYSSWLDYWEKSTEIKATACHNTDCRVSARYTTLDGAHVQRDTPNDNHWWIVPLCHKCNTQFGAHFTVASPLVRVTDPTVIHK